MDDAHARLRELAMARRRIAVGLTLAMIGIYFGFIALVAYDRPLLATVIVPGVTLGILAGALVIVASWLLTYVYVRWTNVKYDIEVAALSRGDAR